MIYKLVIPAYQNTKESLEEEYEQKKYIRDTDKEDTISGILEVTPALLSVDNVYIYTDGILEVVPHHFDKFNEGDLYSELVTSLEKYYCPLTPEELVELIDKQMKEQDIKKSSIFLDTNVLPTISKDIMNRSNWISRDNEISKKQDLKDDENNY